MKYTDLQMADWMWHGWARRWLKYGTDQLEARVLSRMRDAHKRRHPENYDAAQAEKGGAK